MKILDLILSGKGFRDTVSESVFTGICTCGDTGEVGSLCKNCGEEILDSDLDLVDTDKEETIDSREYNQRRKDYRQLDFDKDSQLWKK